MPRYCTAPWAVPTILALTSALLAIFFLWYAFHSTAFQLRVTSMSGTPYRLQEHRVLCSQRSTICAAAGIASSVILVLRFRRSAWSISAALVSLTIGIGVIAFWMNYAANWEFQTPTNWP